MREGTLVRVTDFSWCYGLPEAEEAIVRDCSPSGELVRVAIVGFGERWLRREHVELLVPATLAA